MVGGVFTGFWVTTGVDPSPESILAAVAVQLAGSVNHPAAWFISVALIPLLTIMTVVALVVWLLASDLRAKIVGGSGFASGFLFALNPIFGWAPYLGVIFLLIAFILSS